MTGICTLVKTALLFPNLRKNLIVRLSTSLAVQLQWSPIHVVLRKLCITEVVV